jgi:signal transduction histidine kinase
VTLAHDDGTVRIAIRDDGSGFEPGDTRANAEGGGFGLFNIRERLTHFGGQLTISTQIGAGTEVIIMAPVQPQVE